MTTFGLSNSMGYCPITGNFSKRAKRDMGETDQRQIMRDSLFVMAGLRFAGKDKELRVKIRNLSAGGLMAEGDFRVTRGAAVAVDIRNLGWVDGVIAWVQDSRFGIALLERVVHMAVRFQQAGA